jgi:maltose alpha-D-glucosyltransferase/alpha-amylase
MDMPSPDAFLLERTGPWFELVATLGRRTAQLHASLSNSKHADFVPEPYTPFYQRALAQGFRVQARHSLRLLKANLKGLDNKTAEKAAGVLAQEPYLLDRLYGVAGRTLRGNRIRGHGDLHLGQVLSTGSDWVFIDFEGEPARSLGDRRVKRSPLRDVAGMVRSFYYAGQFAMRQAAMGVQDLSTDHLRGWARAWYLWTASAYLKPYFEEIVAAGIIAPDAEETRFLLVTFMLDKALYELAYELDNRPTWVDIPLQSILDLLNASPDSGEEAKK